MIAYHGNPKIKTEILAQLAAHRAADELIQGRYWEYGKGCAVGCTVHGSDHSQYEPLFGIPQALAYLEDRIFEELPSAKAQAWPERFMRAIEPGADLTVIQWQFLHWLLTDETVNPEINNPLVRDAIAACAQLMADPAPGRTRIDDKNAAVARRAASAAASAASVARSAESAWSRMADKLVELMAAQPGTPR